MKSLLRDAARSRRAEAYATGAAHHAEQITQIFLTQIAWRSAEVIAGYLPIGLEADIMPLLTELARQDARLALPVVIGKALPLVFRRWRPGDPLTEGPHGTRHPGALAEAVAPDLLMVPLLAFDEKGTRLGYGGGYYDRSLAQLRTERSVRAIGIAFAAQYFSNLPHDPLDQRLDGVITEQGYREFGF
jgi:5-formyltetrahydrofolate cyclo-ligase